jgi:CRISPR-associated endonuclease/helicase Cas3
MFSTVCGDAPYSYQERLADAVLAGSSVVLRAPTGAGKTRASVLPFLSALANQRGPGRLIYVLPMRTLAQGIHRECSELVRHAAAVGLLNADTPPEPVYSEGDVRLQTGEAPGDPFFSQGKIVVATYDQLLSGLLHAPYGLSRRLHNINSAVLAGALVVFDEFHLMEIGRAFMTAAAFVKWYEGLCQTVWMTATATQPVVSTLTGELGCVEVALSEAEEAALPSVASVERSLDWRAAPLTATEILGLHERRTIVICNTVGRAQELAIRLRQATTIPIRLLHSRFFQRHRREREAGLKGMFGRNGHDGGILVATQVVEAGLDLSGEHLWTELCPMNALVQRAGRCARFPGERGTVHVRSAPSPRPYLQADLDATAATLPTAAEITPHASRVWVDSVHSADDLRAVRTTTVRARLIECRGVVHQQVRRTFSGGVSHLIREADDNVFVMIRRDPPTDHIGYERVRIGRRGLIAALDNCGALTGRTWRLSDWDQTGPTWEPINAAREIGGATVVCLHPDVCCYDDDGLRAGIPGRRESDRVPPPLRPGHAPLRREGWLQHALAVARHAAERLERDGLSRPTVVSTLERRWALAIGDFQRAAHHAGALHDLGKLQRGWKAWSQHRQRILGSPCGEGEFLAHTDDGTVQEELSRPPHATAGAVIASRLRDTILAGENDLLWAPMLAAIVAHHGGWADDRAVDPVEAAAVAEVVKLLGRGSPRDLAGVANGRRALDELDDIGEDTWPLAAILTRIVRLSDQRATAEWCGNA